MLVNDSQDINSKYFTTKMQFLLAKIYHSKNAIGHKKLNQNILEGTFCRTSGLHIREQ